MEGNIHIPRILMWINFLSCLKSYTKTTSIQHLLHTVMNLNSSSEYIPFLQSVFKDLYINLIDGMTDEQVQEYMEEAVSYVKTTYNVLDSSKNQIELNQNNLDTMLREFTQRVPPPNPTRTLNDYMIQRQPEDGAQIRGLNRAQTRPFFTTTGQVFNTNNTANAAENFWATPPDIVFDPVPVEDPRDLDIATTDFMRGTL
ncbi:MAG: hypothetical protein IPJ48_17650 [Propionivibrio sp.]|uniref:Uncharacterized protein n=1 Tax=Candidatus Propionivibrio dominans TaxID=2954373 RepID=A0A9D7FFL8_9RHOO|nr:hypothetical protein [Candidatus Propionivibrio dominans]